jgi:hypothetical protein
MKKIFYKFMYRNKIIKLKADSGRTYIIEYHRSPFWTYEDPTLKLFFKEKIKTWHGQVWKLHPNGGRIGFTTVCMIDMFPRRQMKYFLIREVNRLEKIFNKEN